MSAAGEKKFVIKRVFADVMKIGKNLEWKEEVIHSIALSWLNIVRYGDNFKFFLMYHPSFETNNWSIETEIELKLINGNKQKRVVLKHVFHKIGSIVELTSVHKEKMRNYLNGGNLSTECHVRIITMTGIEKNLRSFDERSLSDVVLIVENEKFYVLKAYLASHSSYFKSLFNGNFNESKQSEITLNDTDPHDFQHFLELIHGESAIDDDTIEGILYLADMYDSPTAIRRCEEFLIEKSEQTMQEKFKKAMKYKMNALKIKCQFKIRSRYDMWSIMPEDAYEIDPQTWKELLKGAARMIPLTSSDNSSIDFIDVDFFIKKNRISKKLKNFDDKSMMKCSDIVLIVEDEKFYVHKNYLAHHSAYFESLFSGNFNESNQSEITLNDIDPKDFQTFLELIYGESPIDDECVFGILELADMYDSQTAIRRCEKFLIEKSKYSLKKKFQASVTHKMEQLKAKCLSELKTRNDISSVMPEDAYEIDPPTWKQLLSCALDLGLPFNG